MYKKWLTFLKLREARKQVRQLLKEARYLRHNREDIADPALLNQLTLTEAEAKNILKKSSDITAVLLSAKSLALALKALKPKRAFNAWRENIEVIVVAVAVALAFRTYFVQPFKIPTSSMAPTLCGITYAAPPAELGWFDRSPLKLLKWVIFGEWYVEVKAKQAGITQLNQDNKGRYWLTVGSSPHEIFPNMELRVSPGQTVYRGQILARGIRTAGDHIFVNRLIWHFRQPYRGEIMVFTTTDIEHPQIKKNEHYVKRMVGLPAETLEIRPPFILIDGEKTEDSPMLQKIQSASHGYAGYLNHGDYLRQNNKVNLKSDEYFACGDNQENSLDSRYWGPVNRRNLVGPTFFVYWPLSKRWGPTH